LLPKAVVVVDCSYSLLDMIWTEVAEAPLDENIGQYSAEIFEKVKFTQKHSILAKAKFMTDKACGIC